MSLPEPVAIAQPAEHGLRDLDRVRHLGLVRGSEVWVSFKAVEVEVTPGAQSATAAGTLGR
jgi:hypothetical protein